MAEHAELLLDQVQPFAVLERVVPLEAFDEVPRFGRRECLLERSGRMRILIVLLKDDLGGCREVDVAQVALNLHIIDAGPPFGDLHVPPAFKRREQHERIGRTFAFVFVVKARRLAGLHRERFACLRDQLLEVSSRQTSGRVGSCGGV